MESKIIKDSRKSIKNSIDNIIEKFKNDPKKLETEVNPLLENEFLTKRDIKKYKAKIEYIKTGKYEDRNKKTLKMRIAAVVTASVFLVGGCIGYIIGKKNKVSSNSSNKVSAQDLDNSSSSDKDLDNSTTSTENNQSDNNYIYLYCYDFHDLDIVSTNLANLADTNISNLDGWLAGSSDINEDTQLMIKFYIAANINTLCESDSVYSSIISNYTATDLYTSFFQVLDDLQTKAVFATGDDDIRLSKYFISTVDRNYLEKLEDLLIAYNNSSDKERERELIASWIDKNVVRQDYGDVSKSAIITSYRLIQNARLTNAVLNVKELDNINSIEELEKVDDKYKTTPDYLITKFLDSKEISCKGYLDTNSNTILSDDSIDFINNILEVHQILFNQSSKDSLTNEEFTLMIVNKRTKFVEEKIKSDEELKDEYLSDLEKVNPKDPVFSSDSENTNNVNKDITETEKKEIQESTEAKLSNDKVIKDSDKEILANADKVDTYDIDAYQKGYNEGSLKGANDGASGKPRNPSINGKLEYIEGYKKGYDEAYKGAKAIYDKAKEENKTPKVTYEEKQIIEEPSVKEGVTITESEVKTSGGDLDLKNDNITESDVKMEFVDGITVDSNGNLKYDGEDIYLDEEDREWFNSMYNSTTSEKVYTKSK